jgi:hypothetical protein
MILASPFVKGGLRGIYQISPNPSLLKRGIKRIFS